MAPPPEFFKRTTAQGWLLATGFFLAMSLFFPYLLGWGFGVGVMLLFIFLVYKVSGGR